MMKKFGQVEKDGKILENGNWKNGKVTLNISQGHQNLVHYP